jgi:hypothetical protein
MPNKLKSIPSKYLSATVVQRGPSRKAQRSLKNSLVSLAPTSLKRGSIYRVLGGPVAHYRGEAYDNWVVMSVHGQPLLVSRDRVRLAGDEDVSAYLNDSEVG